MIREPDARHLAVGDLAFERDEPGGGLQDEVRDGLGRIEHPGLEQHRRHADRAAARHAPDADLALGVGADDLQRS